MVHSTRKVVFSHFCSSVHQEEGKGLSHDIVGQAGRRPTSGGKNQGERTSQEGLVRKEPLAKVGRGS